MAGYYKQCDCGRYADVVPCYDCLWEENKRLREALSGVRSAIKNNLPDVAIEMADEALDGGGDLR